MPTVPNNTNPYLVVEDNIIRFNYKFNGNPTDTEAAEIYFSALLEFQAAVVEATARNLNNDPDDDLLVYVEGLGPVSPGDPATLRAITFQEEFYERGSEIISIMLQKTTQIIENTSKAAAGM